MTDVNSNATNDHGIAPTSETVKQQLPYVAILVGRQSYDLNTQEYKLIPSIDTIARAAVATPIEAWELYQHFLEIADTLNNAISEIVDAYNDSINKDEDDEDVVIDTSDDDDPQIDFTSVFDARENPFLATVEGRIREGGYSQMSVYMEYRYQDGTNETVIIQPSDIEDLTRISN